MIILSSGLTKTGAIGWISQKRTDFGGKNELKLFVVIIGTAAVAIFLPIALGLARDHRISQSSVSSSSPSGWSI